MTDEARHDRLADGICPCCDREMSEVAAKRVAAVMRARELLAGRYPEGTPEGNLARKPVELMDHLEVASVLGFLALEDFTS